jgi:hypothetical protein
MDVADPDLRISRKWMSGKCGGSHG